MFLVIVLPLIILLSLANWDTFRFSNYISIILTGDITSIGPIVSIRAIIRATSRAKEISGLV